MLIGSKNVNLQLKIFQTNALLLFFLQHFSEMSEAVGAVWTGRDRMGGGVETFIGLSLFKFFRLLPRIKGPQYYDCKQRLLMADSSDRVTSSPANIMKMCVLLLSRKGGKNGVFFANPHHPNTETQKLQSRLSPRWGIHKVQQMKTKRFQLPLAAGNGSD